jgi:hypothetical protein
MGNARDTKQRLFKNYCRVILTNEVETWAWPTTDIN